MPALHKLPAEHVSALLAEAGRLQQAAQRLLDGGAASAAGDLLRQARLLAGDAASYVLPSGMMLSAMALLSTLDWQIAALGE